MIIRSTTKIYFSPTGTTKKVIEAIEEGMGIKHSEVIDLTLPKVRNAAAPIIKTDMVFLGVPVYETGIPKILIPFLKTLKGNGKPIVLVAVYGNISEGTTLNELYSIAQDGNFKVLGAASFIGEHSFSTEETPIAKGRPDNNDLTIAKEFGRNIMCKLQSLVSLHNKTLQLPQGKTPLMAKIVPANSAKFFAKTPIADKNKCSHCGICVRLCPTGAIDKDTLSINSTHCLRCFSCVKGCPKKAREITYRPKLVVSKVLLVKSKVRKEPQLYF
ncbi:NAD(P)H-quinone oxidoreductase subunit I, chloroplastic [Anaerotignum neopropionicum]|uniref:Ferredoxin n=1 Tax=Anaerotignum neopropionicum TaxID=36847 RepID=A0A136WB91_9FIRM|nr:EFR1 family ferrodoxin [Anaerotignum neopropionicum]KXL51783.1 NAD(P)H-quinone oxidoreductase subunit I, chloroplastic [Anaerotignum neopropionicum]